MIGFIRVEMGDGKPKSIVQINQIQTVIPKSNGGCLIGLEGRQDMIVTEDIDAVWNKMDKALKVMSGNNYGC